MPNRAGYVRPLAWPAEPTGIGVAAVLVATALALGLQQLYADGIMGMIAAFTVGVALAITHFAIILVVVLRTRSRVWAAYLGPQPHGLPGHRRHYAGLGHAASSPYGLEFLNGASASAAQ